MTGETDRHISGNKITTRNKSMNSYYMLKWTGKIYQTQEEVDNSPHVKGAGRVTWYLKISAVLKENRME